MSFLEYLRNISGCLGALFDVYELNKSLTIDRKSETLKSVHGLLLECQVTNVYHISGGISNLLDGLEDLNLTNREGNPPDAVDNPDDVKEYSMKIRWRFGQVDELDGTYDKLSLPEDFPKLAEKVRDFIRFYGLGEFFNVDAYSRKKRRESDLIFCKVIFADAEKDYTYLADEDIYEKGDFAWAPTGKDNEKKIVRVTNVEYLQPDEAPFLVEKIKKLIRRLTPLSMRGMRKKEKTTDKLAILLSSGLWVFKNQGEAT